MRVPVESSLLAWVAYDAARHRLRVQLHTGEHYLYFQVPPNCYQGLLNAASKGVYFNRHIRNCFPYQHLSQPSAPVVLAAPRKTK
jgi:hypothetical protein